MKRSSVFVCSECGASSPKWLGRCPSCGKFNSYVEEVTEAEPSSKFKSVNSGGKVRATRISEVKYESYNRKQSGIGELDSVLGGGIVKGSLVLLGGDPGIGKSTLLTQVAASLAKDANVLYVSAEESPAQVKMRCERLQISPENLYLLNETCVEDIEGTYGECEYVVIDSIQTVYTQSLSASAGSVSQIRECTARFMRTAKSRNITFFIIGHVTKEGAIAGPKLLEHLVDTVLYFEGEKENNYRILRAVKNRFGSVQEMGVFEMTDMGIVDVADYGQIFLSDARGLAAGSAVTVAESGNRCMAVEIQSLVCKSVYGMPKRMPSGIDINKTILLTAVLERRCAIPLFNFDVYVNVMGGIRISEPAVDLSVCASLVSAFKNIPIDRGTAFFGEVGLTGEVRGVSLSDKRVNECIKMGFKRIILPKKNVKACQRYADKIEIVGIGYLSEMISLLFRE